MDTHIASYLRAGRTERIGLFQAGFDAHDDSPFLSYAVPDENAEPAAADIAELVAEFRARGRKPRLEYLPSTAPAVKDVLLAAGFTEEGFLPIMTCTRESLVDSELAPGLELVTATTDDDLFATMRALNIAYDGPPAGEHDTARARSMVERGGLVMQVRTADGDVVGGGMLTPPRDGTTEVVAIGVIPQWRGQGIAVVVTVALARAAYSSGLSVPFLTAAGEREARIYNRAGFTTTGRILHISHPTNS